MTNYGKILEDRAKLVHDARVILDEARSADREMTADESARFDKMMDDAGKLKNDAERIRKMEDAESWAGESRGTRTNIETATTEDVEERKNVRPIDSDEYRDAFENYLLSGAEYRDLKVGLGDEGGYITPTAVASRFWEEVDDLVFVRQHADVTQLTSASSLGAPTLENDPGDADWTGEVSAVSEDTTMSFGQRELNPQLCSKLVKVSRKLLRLSPQGAEALVRRRLAYKFGITHEKAFLTGTGANEPLGVFTASASGISTGRDVSTGNSSTAIAADNLRTVKYSLKAGYRAGARWLFHRDAVSAISKLTDGNGQYLWQAGISADDPDSLLGMPVDESEYAPNTFTSGLYVGILANWNYYAIADSLAMEVQRLDELYAANNHVGFIGRAESDGMPVFENAFARVTLA